MDAHSTRVKNAAGEDFLKYKVDGLKNFLKELGIQLSDGGKGKRKVELVDLCEKAAEMKQAKLEDTVEDPVLMREKLRRGLQQLHPESVAIQFLPKRTERSSNLRTSSGRTHKQ